MITPMLRRVIHSLAGNPHDEDASAPGLIHMAATRLTDRRHCATRQQNDASIASFSNSLGVGWCIVKRLVDGFLHRAVGPGLPGPIAALRLRTLESKPG
jgi:hypothetical protein